MTLRNEDNVRCSYAHRSKYTYLEPIFTVDFALVICCAVSTDSVYRKQLHIHTGRALAQAVSYRLPTAAAQVRAQVRSCGIYNGRSGTGAGFLLVLQFPLPIRIPPTAPHSSPSVVQGWYNRPVSNRRTK
jgi:hypothetical protein